MREGERRGTYGTFLCAVKRLRVFLTGGFVRRLAAFLGVRIGEFSWPSQIP